VGEAGRAEALIGGMDAELARLAATRPARPMRVVAWSGGGSVPGRGTLTDAIIGAAGAENVAAKYADGRYSSFGLEELLAIRPDAVMQGSGRQEPPSLRGGNARHPLIDRLFAGRQIDYPDASYTCGLPQSAKAAADLRRALAAVSRQGPPQGPRW
jgi:iron complex transport system substrate-binding protein